MIMGYCESIGNSNNQSKNFHRSFSSKWKSSSTIISNENWLNTI